jgi:hypothetical protein
MWNINRVIYKKEFMRLDVDDGVGSSILIAKKSNDIDTTKLRYLTINDEQEAKEVIKLIEKGIEYLKTGWVEE